MLKLKKAREEYKTTSYVEDATDFTVAIDANGERCLVTWYPPERVLVCHETGKYLTEEDTNNQGELLMDWENHCYCKEYADENMSECEVCHRVGHCDRGIWTEEDEFLCDGCFEEYGFPCSDCGNWHMKEWYDGWGLVGRNENREEVRYCNRCKDKYYIAPVVCKL